MPADCLFCSIVAGDVPGDTVAETARVLAFRDIAPAAPTHVLVVPKQHIGDVRDIRPEHGEVLAEMMALGADVARRENVEASGYRFVFNVGADAGQTVFHLHMHVVGGKPLGGVA